MNLSGPDCECFRPPLAGQVRGFYFAFGFGAGLDLPAVDMAMAMAWGRGLPAAISVRILEEMVAGDLPFFSGIV
jgi:hypothetical protein